MIEGFKDIKMGCYRFYQATNEGMVVVCDWSATHAATSFVYCVAIVYRYSYQVASIIASVL